MSKLITETLAAYRQSVEEQRIRKTALVDELGQLVGSRVAIVGYPEFATVQMRDINFRITGKSNIPVYRLFDENREPRTADDCTITHVTEKSIAVALKRDEEDEPCMTEFLGYTFPLNSLLSVELLPETVQTR